MSKSAKEHLSIIRQHKETARCTLLKVNDALDAAVFDLSPVKIGQVVEIDESNRLYRGRTMKIVNIWMRIEDETIVIVAQGAILIGSLGLAGFSKTNNLYEIKS